VRPELQREHGVRPEQDDVQEHGGVLRGLGLCNLPPPTPSREPPSPSTPLVLHSFSLALFLCPCLSLKSSISARGPPEPSCRCMDTYACHWLSCFRLADADCSPAMLSGRLCPSAVQCDCRVIRGGGGCGCGTGYASNATQLQDYVETEEVCVAVVVSRVPQCLILRPRPGPVQLCSLV